MRAMILEALCTPLKLIDIPIPKPTNEQVLIQIAACAICRTDLHIINGELPSLHLPLILGHQIVGAIVEIGKNVKSFKVGNRVGVPWLGGSCGKCFYCTHEKENLCDQPIHTGYTVNGGFAEYCVVDPNYIFLLPSQYGDEQVAPLLCGGLIGFRSYKMTQDAKNIGFYGFGSSAHILTQIAVSEKKQIFAFTRPKDISGQVFARSMGAVWAGAIDEKPPVELDAAILFAPVGNLVPIALKAIRKGGSVICAGIHMSDIPSFPYEILYGEKILRSVTNLTRKDGKEFFNLISKISIQPQINVYPLEEANQALEDLQRGNFSGSGVLRI